MTSDIVKHWKTFHEEIGTILGCEYREVNVTLEAAKELVLRVKKQKRQIKRLLGLMKESRPAFPEDCEKWDKEIKKAERLLDQG